MIKYIDGDLLETDVDVIVHQTNCLGVMGAGIALQIKKKYPEVFDGYKYHCSTTKSSDLLGECLIIPTDDGRYVANVCGEEKYYPKGVRHTDYEALEHGLKFLKIWMRTNGIKTCGCPYLMGCGLAGGDWNVVVKILERIFNDDEMELTIVKYNK